MALLIRFWYIPVILLLIAALAFSGLYAKTMRQEAQIARKELSIAVEVNKKNAKAMEQIRQAQALERALTEKETAATQERATAAEGIKKELQNVEGANDRAPAYFDELSKRLQQPNH